MAFGPIETSLDPCVPQTKILIAKGIGKLFAYILTAFFPEWSLCRAHFDIVLDSLTNRVMYVVSAPVEE